MTIMAGSKAFVESLRLGGTEYVFGLPGSTEILFLDALEDCPDIKYILCLHEAVALGMAEGYARASGKVGVVNLHNCPGLAAASPMLYNAKLGGIPIVVTAGQQDTRLLMQEPAMSGDLVSLASNFAKWSTEVIHAEDIPLAIRRAFKVATQSPTGPVFLSLPHNIMADKVDYQPDSACSQIISMRPDQVSITQAVELLCSAKNPAIIVGDGIAKNNALNEITKFAELIGAPVYQAWMADVNFPTRHPLYMGVLIHNGHSASEILKSVDVLTVIGAPLFAPAFYSSEPLLTSATKIIQMDDNPWQIGKNYPVASGLAGHIDLSLGDLNDALSTSMTKEIRNCAKTRAEFVAREKQRNVRSLSEIKQQENNPVNNFVFKFIEELQSSIKAGTILIEEWPSYSLDLQNAMDFKDPLSYIRARNGGSIGWGMPAALGAKLALPDRPVVAIIGDGCAIWSIQSLWTASHYKLPITFIIWNNASYNVLKFLKNMQMGDRAKERCLGMDFNEPRINFCEMAHSMGIQGQKVERPEELRDVLKSAFSLNEPNVVEIYV